MSNYVVADKYILQAKSNGKYLKEGTRQLVQKGKVLPRTYVEDRNSHENNELYVIDETATEELQELRAQSLKENEAKRKKESLTQADLVDAMVKMAGAVKGDSKESSNEDEEKEELRAKLDELGVKYSNRAGVKKLKELLDENSK